MSTLPPQCTFGFECCCFCVCNLPSEECLKVFSQHARWTGFDNLANLRCELNAAEIRQASHPRKQDVDNQPLDVIVSAPRHHKMCDEPWITRCSLQRVQRTCFSWHERQLCARDFHRYTCAWICEGPCPRDRLYQHPAFESSADGGKNSRVHLSNLT